MKFECPSCQRTIFNRRLEKCEFCNETIPEKLRLSDEEKLELRKEYQESSSRKSEIEGLDKYYNHHLF